MVDTIITVRNRYSAKKAKGLFFSKDDPQSVSRTKQSFKKEANINEIMKKYAKSGLLVNPAIRPTAMPQFGDFSGVTDYQSLQNKLIAIRTYFESLPARIRKRFNNSPQELLAFMSDDSNKDEALKLGLLNHSLENVRYEDSEGNDITDKVIAERGLFVNGKRVNRDGTPYVEPAAPVEGADPTS